MRKSSLRAVVLMLSSTWVLAQSGAALENQYPSSAPPSAQQPAQQPDKSQTAGGDTIEGCLGRSADNFTLTDASGTTYYLAGDSGKLATHVGQQVRITGGDIPVAPGAATSGATSGAAGGGHKFAVKKVKTLASSCAPK